MPATSFADKTVLITGATSGIGRSTALAFARRGANLALVGLNAARGESIVAGCEREGGRARFIQADVADSDRMTAAVAETCDSFGGLDVAFNNAGVQERRAVLAEQSDAVFDAVFAVNVRAVFQLMKAEIAAMLRGGRGGAIVNNASASGVRNPNPGLSVYSASRPPWSR